MKVNFSSILNDLTERNVWKNSLKKILNLTVTDTDISGIETDISNLETLVEKPYQTLTSASTITMDIENGANAKLVMGHNVVLTLDNLTNGSEGNIIIVQDASNFTLSILPSPYVINGGGGGIVLTDGAGAITILSYTYDGTNLYINYGSNYTPGT